MRNKYPGNCYVCGKWIKAQEGHFEKVPFKKRERPDSPKWKVQCAVHPLEKRANEGDERAKAALSKYAQNTKEGI